jgi:parallel beta-helix repeat protein
LICSGFIPISLGLNIRLSTIEHSSIFGRDDTLYVGGNGPDNYTKIQDAIDNATDGDTIFVYDDSSPYFEKLVIHKSIHLEGEDKNATIIDGNRTDGDVINVIADDVTIIGFTIQHSGKQKGDSGIKIHSNNNIVKDNIIRENGWKRYYYEQGGLYLNEGSNNAIINNTIINNRETGIYLHHSENNIIQNNTIYENTALGLIYNASSHNQIVQNEVYENYCGMTFWPYSTYNTIEKNHIHDHPGCGIAFKMYSNHNIIRYNRIVNNLEWGIMLGFGPIKHTIVEYNLISGTTGGAQNWFGGSGLVLSIAFYNTIKYNNFLENKNDIYLENSLFNHWNQNYWDRYIGFGVKIILGHFAKLYTYHPELKIPWINIDWHPASEPYDISEPKYPSVVVNVENSKIKITLTKGGNNYPSTGYSFADSVTIRLNGTALEEIKLVGNTGWEVGESIFIGGSTPVLDDEESNVNQLSPGSYFITVIIKEIVIFDDLITIV